MSCRSFIEAKSVDGVQFLTFQSACITAGLCNDQIEAERCFRDALIFSSPAELRGLFVLLTVQGFATMNVWSNQELHDSMRTDFATNYDSYLTSQRMADNDLLHDLAERFADQGKTLSQYGFPEPLEIKTELQKERVRYDPNEQVVLLRTLEHESPNNLEQQQIYDEIVEALNDDSDDVSDSEQGTIFFVQGQGGSGKTTLAKKLLALVRSKSHIALGCASTGLAATNFEDFYTAHALFCIPVIEDDDLEPDQNIECQLHSREERLELLFAAKVIIWDEFPSNHRNCFEAAYRALDGFKGKIIICMGDFRQIGPVVQNGSISDIVHASIQSSPLWPQFQVRVLRKNMRLEGFIKRIEGMILIEPNTEHEHLLKQIQDQIKYGETLLSLGEAKESECDNLDYHSYDEDSATSRVSLKSIEFFLDKTQQNDALKYVFPNGHDPNTMHKNVIIASTNEIVDDWNKIVQNLNNNPSQQFVSHDYLCEVDDPRDVLKSMLTDDVLNRYTTNGVPPHILELKVGDICILLRSLSRKDKLATNTRVRILRLQRSCVYVQTLTPNPRCFAIPRIRFKFQLPWGKSYQMIRTQYPLRLSYAITVNKAQGQEYEKVLYDIRENAFSHGHTYVAFSRSKRFDTIRLYCKEENILGGRPVLSNIVYNDLIRSIL
jgi:hypothetical protein